MGRDPFIDFQSDGDGQQYVIHIHSPEEAEVVYDYYDRVYGVNKCYNTSTVNNCMQYPYLVMSGSHIGANLAQYGYQCKEFHEWLDFVGISEVDFEFEPTLALSDLFDIS